MALIPGGEFILGHEPHADLPSFMSDRTSSQNAEPKQTCHVDSFYLDRFEVTSGEFLRFKPKARYANTKLDHPMQGVSWYEAEAYCFWRGKRLPTEFEWERAARGTKGNLYVWGTEFVRSNANLGKNVLAVGSVGADKTPEGVYDLNGNVSEWTSSWYQPYAGSTFKDPNFGKEFKVIRGGAINKREHGFLKEFATLPFRNFAPPEMRSWDTGFRCAKTPEPKPEP